MTGNGLKYFFFHLKSAAGALSAAPSSMGEAFESGICLGPVLEAFSAGTVKRVASLAQYLQLVTLFAYSEGNELLYEPTPFTPCSIMSRGDA